MLCIEPSIQQETSFGNSTKVVVTTTTESVFVQPPGPYDVICGRHKAAFNNIGNRRFRVTVSLSVGRYIAAPTRKDKSVVIKSIAAMVRSTGGRFLQQHKNTGDWIELDEKLAHDKVGHAMRDMVAKKAAANRGDETASVGSTYTSTVRTGLSTSSAAKKSSSSASKRKVPKNIAVTILTPQQEVPAELDMPLDNEPAAVETQDLEVMEEFDLDDFSISEDSLLSLDYNEALPENLDYFCSGQQQQQLPAPQQQQNETASSLSAETTSVVPAQQQQSTTLPLQQQSETFEFAETAVVVQEPDERRDSVDDQMLSWLICESNTLLSGFETL